MAGSEPLSLFEQVVDAAVETVVDDRAEPSPRERFLAGLIAQWLAYDVAAPGDSNPKPTGELKASASAIAASTMAAIRDEVGE